MKSNMTHKYQNKRNNFFNLPQYTSESTITDTTSSHHIYSAGILPYQVQDNNIFFLLGKDNNGEWSDFGGKCDPNDRLNIKETAAREFFEESLNSIMSLSATRNMLRNNKNFTMVNSKSMAGLPYYMFILRVPMIPDTANDRFKKTLEFLRYINAKYQYMEKVAIGWISLETLLLILENSEYEKTMGWPLRKVFKKTLYNHKNILNDLRNKTMYKK